MRHRVSAIFVGIAVAGSLAASLVTGNAQEATADATQAGVVGDAVDVSQCTDAAPADAAAVYTIAADGTSTARYRAQEELQGLGDTEAVGETQAIVGTLYLDESGTPLACSRIDVDLRTLQSDEARRDNYLYDNTLETGTYPLATFVATDVVDLGAGLADGEETVFHLRGNLTIHGETRQVVWEITAIRDGDQINGTGTTNFDMPDFGIEPPTVGPVVSLDENVALEIDVTATLAP